MAVNSYVWHSEPKTDPDGSRYAEITCHTDATADNDNVDKYLFEVWRYKITATKEEYLNVRVYEAKRDEPGSIVKASGEVCAEIENTSIVDLESKLLNLRVYGILLGRKQFPKIRQLIEKIYPGLSIRYVDTSTVVSNDVIMLVYDMFARYIKEVGIEAQNGLYNIPVDEFKDYLADTDYSRYKYSDIRKGLAELKMENNGESVKVTKCSFGRNDNTIAKGDKRIKVISFVQDVLDSYQITKLPED